MSESRDRLPLLLRLLGWLLRPWIERIPVSAEFGERLRGLGEQGRVVFVMRKANWVDVLVWRNVCRRARVPEPPAVAGLMPVGPQALPSWSLLFLDGPQAQQAATLIEECVDAARAGARVLLQPITILWDLSPRRVERSLLEILFRPRERAGLLRRIMWVVLGARGSRIVAADPVDLQQLTSEDTADTPRLARKVRLTIRYHLAQAERAYLGPRLIPRQRLIERALNDPAVQQVADEVARERGVSRDVVLNEVRENLDEIAADFRWSAIRFLAFVLSHVWRRIYEGFNIDLAGLERIRDAARRGPVILVPCHRSHMDYLIISYIFKEHELIPPHIAAGDNLSFFPLGPLFRRSGAFFIRRSFLGDRIYESALRAYIRALLRASYNIEFFIEGTRSRSGKIMPPKFGLLTMLLDAQSSLQHTECQVVPIAIDYESVLEESSMVREAQGAEKQKESVAALLAARRKLRRKYGRVYVRFGEPKPLRQMQAAAGDGPTLEQARRVAYDILWGIQRLVTVTPTALVATSLCVHHKRGIRRATLLRRIRLFQAAVERAGAHLATDVEVGEHLDRALALFERNRVVRLISVQQEEVYTVDDSRRMALDYYKNNIVHFLVNTSFACLAFRLGRDDTFDQLWEAYSRLHALFVEEFHRVYCPPTPDELRGELEWLASQGLVASDGDRWRVLEPVPVMAFENVTRNFLESAYIAVVALLDHDPAQPRELREWQRLTLEMGELLFAKGDIWRPEARNKVNLGNALNSFRHSGLLQPEPDGSGRKGQKDRYFVGPEGIDSLREMSEFLQRILVEIQLN